MLDRRTGLNCSTELIHQGTRYFAYIGGTFVAVLLLSNISAQKLFPLGPFVFSAAILLFPISYIFGDVLTEVYGYAKSRQIIWTGLGCNILMALFFWIAIELPPAPGWDLQSQFSAVLGLVPRTVVASIVGYWAGEFSNSYTLAKLKLWTRGRFLWIRTISSTVVGEGIDTVLFVSIAFGGIFPAGLLLTAMWSAYLFKVMYEVLATPITYLIVNFLKRAEGIDVFDWQTNFNPFRVKS